MLYVCGVLIQRYVQEREEWLPDLCGGAAAFASVVPREVSRMSAKRIFAVILALSLLLVSAASAEVTLQVWNRNGLMGDIVNAFNAKMEAEGKAIKLNSLVRQKSSKSNLL